MGGKTIDQRIAFLAAGFGIMLAALTGRLFYLQILQHQRLAVLAARQQERTLDIQPARGRIFDRQGRPLALNRECASYFAVPAEITDPVRTARLLAPVAGVPAGTLEQRLRLPKDFVWIKRKATDAKAAAIERLSLPGVHRLTETRRVYPEGRLAGHVLGFVGLDNQGLDGIELQYDRAIRGAAGWMRIARDARGHIVETASQVVKEPEPGQDVYLTLDNVVQHIAERELAQAVEKYRARAGSILVLDPGSGEILALANFPDFDPNDFGRFTAEARRNRAVRDLYEPGSTFKLVTAAGALEEKLVSETSMLDCEMGKYAFGGRTVRDHIPHGRISFQDVIGYSSNIGSVKIGQRLGADRMVRYAAAFGFGRPTGVELPGEPAGLLKSAKRWTPATMASVPYGQEVAVTTLQSAVAYAAVANDGWLPRPTVVKELRAPDGTVAQPERPEVHQQAISAATARRLRGILEHAVTQGTGSEAQVTNYLVAGKTGTAQKPLPGGRGYDPVNCVASFIGFLPADQPRLLVAVVIDSPRGLQWGGVVAGPVFKAVGQNLLAYLGIMPGEKEYALPHEKTAEPSHPALPAPSARPAAALLACVPDVTGLDSRACRDVLQQQGLRSICLGPGGRVTAQRPAAGARLTAGAPVTVYLAGPSPTPAAVSDRVVVPNVSGQSLRNALEMLTAYGLQARVCGSGIVQAQSLRPFTQARLGAICTLNCQDPEVLP